MNYNINNYLILFGLSKDDFEQDISDPITSEDGVTIYLNQRTDINRKCVYCKSLNVVVKDRDLITLRSTINSSQKISLLIKKVRFFCKNCHRSYTPELTNILPYSKINPQVRYSIISSFFQMISFTNIANFHDVSITTVFEIFDNTFINVQRGTMPRILCIDEFHFSSQYDQNYCCVLVNFETKEIVDILKNRKKEYLNEYFSSIPSSERQRVIYFISDMYDEYLTIKNRYFPNAIHIVDRFHVIIQLTRAINKRRNKIMKDIIYTKPILCGFMKANWQLYEKSENYIPNKEYHNKKTGLIYSYRYLFFESLKLDYSLNVAYSILQKLIKDSYTKKDNEILPFFMNISEKLGETSDEELQKVGKTYIKWITGISNAYLSDSVRMRLTNAIAENTNNHIKTIIKVSYGLRNFERMRKRAIILSRKKVHNH